MMPLQEFKQKQRHARSDLLPSVQQAPMWDSTSTFDFVDTPSDLPAGKCPCLRGGFCMSADVMSEPWQSNAEQQISCTLLQVYAQAGLAAGYLAQQLGSPRPE